MFYRITKDPSLGAEDPSLYQNADFSIEPSATGGPETSPGKCPSYCYSNYTAGERGQLGDVDLNRAQDVLHV